MRQDPKLDIEDGKKWPNISIAHVFTASQPCVCNATWWLECLTVWTKIRVQGLGNVPIVNTSIRLHTGRSRDRTKAKRRQHRDFGFTPFDFRQGGPNLPEVSVGYAVPPRKSEYHAQVDADISRDGRKPRDRASSFSTSR
jgi:hypothetical protein